MSANIIRLLPEQEQALLECYVTGSRQPASFQQLFDAMEVPDHAEPDRLQIAVAQILLHDAQDNLPQWAAITSGGELVTNRRRHRRHKEARLNFNPQLLFSINWATSGSGFEWPEAYYVTYVPGLEKYVFTASRDGDDAWGCEDHHARPSRLGNPSCSSSASSIAVSSAHTAWAQAFAARSSTNPSSMMGLGESRRQRSLWLLVAVRNVRQREVWSSLSVCRVAPRADRARLPGAVKTERTGVAEECEQARPGERRWKPKSSPARP